MSVIIFWEMAVWAAREPTFRRSLSVASSEQVHERARNRNATDRAQCGPHLSRRFGGTYRLNLWSSYTNGQGTGVQPIERNVCRMWADVSEELVSWNFGSDTRTSKEQECSRDTSCDSFLFSYTAGFGPWKLRRYVFRKVDLHTDYTVLSRRLENSWARLRAPGAVRRTCQLCRELQAQNKKKNSDP
jgi:hypothetical protein